MDLFVELCDQCLEKGSNGDRVINAGWDITDAKLKRWEERVRTHIPIDLFAIVDASTMAKRSIGMCVRTRSSQRLSFASVISQPALMTRSPLLPFSRHWSQSSTNYSIKI